MDTKPRKSLAPVQYRKPTMLGRLLMIIAMLVCLVLFENCTAYKGGEPLADTLADTQNFSK